ncbi:hypothetical protein QJS10_CPB19g01823 [Acorus calamus]|uniref:Phosphoribulokinase/uridine kinase domain-containing protein n=1 Tax=Acorus calamus TaxID=4465 RepID=A0AAV9CEZ9_ACOCL|nr:hypothetical protein QJS10_CPB19g01823 [Acorus calamus]
MDDELIQRVLQGGGRGGDYLGFQSPHQPSTSSATSAAPSPSSILQSLSLHVSFDHGYYLLVKAIQELREKKDGLVTVGIGGPCGSGKTSLAEKVASVLGCTIVSMENYRDGVDDGNDLESIDFASLVHNLEVIVDGTYALHSKLRSFLDIRVAVVGGVHFSLLSKVKHDIGDSCSLDYLIDSIFPLFRKHIEPDLHHAQIRINNSFVSSFREPYYKLKCKYEVGRTTLGGLLALGYNVVVSYKRASESLNNGLFLVALESIDTFDKTFMVLKGTSRKVIRAEASRMGIEGPWITKSYLEMILESKGVPRLNTPPPLSSIILTESREKILIAPKPIHIGKSLDHKLEDLDQLWTRSPTKSEIRSVVPSWHFLPSDSSDFRGNIQLAPIPDSYDLDRGLLLSVQAIQALLENKGLPIIVGIGGPSGSGKTSLALKMANIVGCEVISLESYYKSEQVKDFKYDSFSSLDLSLLLKNIDDIRHCHRAKIPTFDFETCTRSGFKEVQVSEDCGVVIIEGVYALHPDIREALDLWIAVLKIRNDFDPVLSPESSLFVLKSNKQPIREGNFIVQPKVDFDISISTVAGLLNLGYQAVVYIEASALIYQDGKILIEVDHLQDVPTPFLQIKGTDKEIVAAAASALSLDGSYTTKKGKRNKKLPSSLCKAIDVGPLPLGKGRKFRFRVLKEQGDYLNGWHN